MKKVGIITYHFAQNYGAVLQCYALQTYLSQQGYAVTVFDFVSEKQQKNNDVVKHGASVKTAVANICLLPFAHSIRKKHARFVDFCQKNLHLTPHFSTVESLEQYIEENGYDVVISGSDQVLNPNINDFEIAFLYPFKTKAKKSRTRLVLVMPRQMISKRFNAIWMTFQKSQFENKKTLESLMQKRRHGCPSYATLLCCCGQILGTICWSNHLESRI